MERLIDAEAILKKLIEDARTGKIKKKTKFEKLYRRIVTVNITRIKYFLFSILKPRKRNKFTKKRTAN